MSKRIVLSVLLSALMGLPAFAASAQRIPGTKTELPKLVTKEGKTYKLGKKPYPAGTRDAWIAEGRALAKTPAGILPSGKMLKGAADNRSYMPPIGDQGNEGSCVHWAGSYNTKTANMKRNDASLNVTAASNQCSPRFTYNLTNTGDDIGGYGHEPFEVFMRYGVPSLAQKPYVDTQYTALPVVADFIEGLHRRTTNYVWLWDWAPDASQIADLKAWLDDGRVAVCGVNAETSFDAWGPGDAPWVGATCTIDDINHMVTVCGYGTGYYLVANQWGTSFGSNGYIVVDSDYFENYFSDVMYPLEGTYEPATDYAKLTIRHGTRSDIRELLITANGGTVWSNSPLPLNMPPGGGGTFDTDSRDNLEIAVDLTQVPWGADNVVTARVRDAVSAVNGTVTVFTVKYDGTEYASPSVPVPVAYNAYTSAWVRLYQSTDTNVCFTSAGAAVGENSGSYVVTVYKTQASGDVSGQVALSGTATEGAGADYTISATNFALNGATTSATFTVTLNDDEDEESAETVVLTLANVAGGIVQAPDVFTLTINASDGSAAADLFISEYVEGSSNNKYIEIFNGTGVSVDLSSYSLRQYNNGSSTATYSLALSGTLTAGDVYVIENSTEALGVAADLSTTSQVMGFNGNDAIALAKSGVNLDVVGTIGSSDNFALDVTKVRKSSVFQGTTTYDPLEWDDYAANTVSYLGSHTFDGSGGPSDVAPVLASIGNKSAIWSNDLSFTVSAADAVDGDSIVLSASGLPAGATFATVTNAGTVTNTFVWNDVGPMGTYNVTFTATDKDGSDSEIVAITIGDGSGPSEIVFQGFEGTPADTWEMTDVDPALVLNTTGSGDTPADQRIRTASYSWQPGESEYTTETLELAEVDVSAYSDVVMTLHLSATATEVDYGMWPGDAISFYLALDGGSYADAWDLAVTGNMLEGDGISGVLWGYDATGIAATTAGVSRTLSPASGGIASDGLATVQIALPAGTTAVKFKANVAQEYAGYFWNVDDISLAGVADGGAVDHPPFIAVDPDQTEITAPVSNAVTFAITGREVPNDLADEVTLWATGLPSGATFPEVSGASILTNTFNWTPTATGTTVVSFFAGDKDGTNQVDVTIEVFEQLPAGTYRAVICGISDYEGTDNDLSYCDDDAQELYDRLLTGSNWSADNIQLLLDSQATEANIQAAIAAMGAASVPGDVNLFFFSGHGGGDVADADGDEGGDGYDEYMCPYNLTTDEITDDELSDWLDALPTDNIIVLLDTCYSGGHLKGASGLTYKGVSRTGAIVTNRTNGFTDDLRKRKNKQDSDELVSPYIATACDETELSAEDPALENGVFAYYLLEALTNSDVNVDGWAAGEEAFDYLYPLTVTSNPEQHPQEYDGWPGLANLLTWEPLADQPPTIALNPVGTNKTVVFDNPLSFTVTATDADGLAVSLAASGLPSGATAPDANGTGTASTTFNWTPGEAQVGTYNVSFSATDDDGTTVLNVKITVRDGNVATDLFISEYIEGSSNNKAIEIFNGTGAPVDLGAAGYVLRLYANGSTSPSTITLAGTVADGDVFVVANTGANAAILAQADQTSGSLTHNGNDVVALAKNDANIDVVGTIGSSANFGLDVTKVRKRTVVEGTTTYDPLEWDDYAVDTVAYLGSHEFGAAEPSAPSFAAIPAQNATEGVLFTLNVGSYVSGNPAPVLSLDSSTADAGDYSFAGGTLSFTPSASGDFDFVFLATNTLGAAGATVDVSVAEAGAELLAPVIQAASAIQAQQFNANWLPSAGATGYILDVGTNDTFSGGDAPVGGNLMSNAGFELGNNTDWDKFEAEYSVVTTAPQEGTYHVACTATATRDLMQTVDITGDGVTEYEISYYYKSSGDGTDVRIWSTWAAGGQVSGDSLTSSTYNATTADWTKMTYHVVPASGANTLNFEVRTYNGGTASLDNFFVGVTPAGRKAPSYVPGYASRDVGNVTTFAVTGLTESVTYYYRVKAYNASSNSPYSGTTNVVTAAGGETPSPQPISNWVPPTNGAPMSMQISSVLGTDYALQYTTNLMAIPPSWRGVVTQAGSGGMLSLQDADSAEEKRFYRIVQP